MDNITRQNLANLHSADRAVQTAAFFALIEATDQPVEWAYNVWDDLIVMLQSRDYHLRAIAAQILCNLAKSDPESRMLRDFDTLLTMTKSERSVTARHTLQSLWKVGIVSKPHQQQVVDGLVRRFHECIPEKNCTLIRYDIVVDLKKMFDAVQDETIRETALALIATEEDIKYRKKYARVWIAKKVSS